MFENCKTFGSGDGERGVCYTRLVPWTHRVDSPQSLSLQNEKIDEYPELDGANLSQYQERLLDGTLSEGTRLTEELLATQLGISKSPVREH